MSSIRSTLTQLKTVNARLVTTLMAGALVLSFPAQACTRIAYEGLNGMVAVGRSMDWVENPQSNMWAFPKGMQRTGASGQNSLRWTSKYGSVITSMYDFSTVDGINEKGLSANVLYLGVADYGKRDVARAGLSVTAWGQYVLDNFATVKEAVDALQADKIQITTRQVPTAIGPVDAVGHLAITDRTGDSAVFEYIGGKLVIHHGHEFNVMTNDPTLDQQLAVNEYWKSMNGAFLPGTENSAERFVRADYYLRNVPKSGEFRQALADTFSIIRNASVPFEPIGKDHPNLDPTMWRTASDNKNLTYYFESTTSPNVVWVSLGSLDLSAKGKVKKLELTGNAILSGDVSGGFKDAKAFAFLETGQ